VGGSDHPLESYKFSYQYPVDHVDKFGKYSAKDVIPNRSANGDRAKQSTSVK